MTEDLLERSPAAMAKRLVSARLAGTPLAEFPGPIPADLPAAYACQDAAIALWPDVVGGWKVGLIGAELAAQLGEDRLAGPIFSRSVWRSVLGASVPFPVFGGGFAAVEAEYVLVVGRDAPAGKTAWTRSEAFDMVRAVHVGVETAGSPLATINELGPCAIVSDFGNNAGLIIGPELAAWRTKAVEEWRCEVFVDGVSVGRGRASMLPGGPFESLRFLLALGARRARPLRAGDVVSAGAVTGVHSITAGQHARVAFDGCGEILCAAEPFGGNAARARQPVP